MMDNAKLWQAVRRRDVSFDGQFLYGVLTTKVFCRPGCASRLPLRENVRFYQTAEEAAAEGLRPCQRCKPLEQQSPRDRSAEAMRQEFQRACSYIRQNLDNRAALKLNALSAHSGMSPFHFQRSFKSVVGVTPRQYAEAIRMQKLKEHLREGESVTDAIYGAGFGASSRVYDGVDSRLGMTPKQYRAGGANIEISYATADTPLGMIMIGATDRGLCFLEFGNSAAELLEYLREEFPGATCVVMSKPYSAQFTGWMQGLSSYLEGERALNRIVPLSLHGTAFQLKVWRYLQTIPPGTVQTYTEVAKAIGAPKSVRAVANACGANSIAVVIPCHRVIRSDGGLGGYRWGLDRKRTLLETERRASLSSH